MRLRHFCLASRVHLSPRLHAQQKQFSEKTKISAIGIVYVNALIAAPLAAFLVVATGELDKITHFQYVHNGTFWTGFAISCAMGLVLTYSSVLSTTYNSPLATSVTGNAKDIATTAIGWLAFSGFKATFKSVGGILISFAGAFLYSYVGLRKQMAANANNNAAANKGGVAMAPKQVGSSGSGTASPREGDLALRHRDGSSSADEETGRP